MNKKDYHDYVIKNGELMTEFEKIYIQSDPIPWNQNEYMGKDYIDIQITICLFESKQIIPKRLV